MRATNIDPIVIVGMHRSGTTMITRMLDDLGLFVGAEKDDNHESIFFWELNRWIFKICFARVDLPHNLRHINDMARQEFVSAIDYHLHSRRKKKFLGKLNGQYKDIRDLDIPWGWKDPHNTFTAEIYRELFPNMKVIHIYRNPMDSARSYLKRDLKYRNNFQLNWKKKLKREFLKGEYYHHNFRLQTLQDGYELWHEYVTKALELKEVFGDNYLELCYEDFLDAPKIHVQKMLDFASLKPSDIDIQKVIKDVNADRKFAFLNNEEAKTFYEKVKNDPLLKQLKYDGIE